MLTLSPAEHQVEKSHVSRGEALSELVTRVEQAMRPLCGPSYGPDHDRVRVLYENLLRTSTGDPLERARRAVLYEMLYGVLVSDELKKRHA